MLGWWKRLLARMPWAQQWGVHHARGGLVMRRRRPDGEVEHREMTAEEHDDYIGYWAMR